MHVLFLFVCFTFRSQWDFPLLASITFTGRNDEKCADAFPKHCLSHSPVLSSVWCDRLWSLLLRLLVFKRNTVEVWTWTAVRTNMVWRRRAETTHAAFPPLFIWAIVKRFTYCVSESSLDMHCRHGGFQRRAQTDHLCTSYYVFPWQVNWKTLLNCFSPWPSQFGVQPLFSSHGDSASARPPPDWHTSSRHCLPCNQTGTQWG